MSSPDSRLETARQTLEEVFKEYADQDGNISKEKCEEMMGKEWPGKCEMLKQISEKAERRGHGGRRFAKGKGGPCGKQCDGKMNFKQFSRGFVCMANHIHNKDKGCKDSSDEDEGEQPNV